MGLGRGFTCTHPRTCPRTCPRDDSHAAQCTNAARCIPRESEYRLRLLRPCPAASEPRSPPDAADSRRRSGSGLERPDTRRRDVGRGRRRCAWVGSGDDTTIRPQWSEQRTRRHTALGRGAKRVSCRLSRQANCEVDRAQGRPFTCFLWTVAPPSLALLSPGPSRPSLVPTPSLFPFYSNLTPAPFTIHFSLSGQPVTAGDLKRQKQMGGIQKTLGSSQGALTKAQRSITNLEVQQHEGDSRM